MSTWQIFSDAGNGFRWKKSDSQPHYEQSIDDTLALPPHLPSMADLLLQGCSTLLENGHGNGNNEITPMFRTGLGKSVAVKKSSISKALSILGDEDQGNRIRLKEEKRSLSNTIIETELAQTDKINGITIEQEDNTSKSTFQTGFGRTNISPSSMFQTGSGKAVNFSAAGLVKAKILLGLEENNDTDYESSMFNDVPEISVSHFNNSLRYESNSIPDNSKAPPIKFQTAGGRSLSISSDALKRARSLLGDSTDPNFSFSEEKKSENDSITPLDYQKTVNNKSSSKNFTSPFKSALHQKQSLTRLDHIGPGNNLIKRFNEEAGDNSTRSLKRTLMDITNTIDGDNKQNSGEKRRLGNRSSVTVSPFKRPRNSKFITPLNSGISSMTSLSSLAPKEPCLKGKVSTRYPIQIPRPYLREYLRKAPPYQSKVEILPDQIRRMSLDTSEKFMLYDKFSSKYVGAEDFFHILSQSGASMHYVSKEWVVHHYKFIIWKLASYERSYPTKFASKLLTFCNVLEELKYRYEREVNNGHRSAIKRILEGDALPSSRMVLCISSISSTSNIELTDGWYSVNAVLDVLLSKKLASGKLFVGQKLLVWGAGLCGWVGPVSPLEASKTICLQLHINGTYRAHWADRLGFCKGQGIPLAFKCIKCAGGSIPCTLIGVSRVYPVLYRERLSSGGFAVRSERMESKAAHSFKQRQSSVMEGIMSDYQKMNNVNGNEQDSEEGAKILKILETAAEPELLMAEMTSDQLNSFSSYRAKLEARRHSDMQKSVEKALEASGLSNREVTPFMRVRVIGLTSKSYPQQFNQQQGLITIWNPTEKQKLELLEGQAYAVSGLLPLSSDSNTIYLQARGSTTKWLPLSQSATQNFRPFFNVRTPVPVSNLGGIPLSKEFDIAGYVIHVGEVDISSNQKKQWVFISDGSIYGNEPFESLLAIRFCLQSSDTDDSFPLLNYNLAGSTVGFCNLIKKEKDEIHNLWVAEATENSIYFLNYDRSQSCHLKEAAKIAQKWATNSSLTIEKLKGRVLSIIGNCEV